MADGENILRLVCVFLILIAVGTPVSADYTAGQYIDDVLSGKQVACRYVRLAVERHVNDLQRAECDDPEFPYYFDEEQAKRVIDFKQQLEHTKGEWANPRKHNPKLRLEPWQQFKDWVVFGWRRKSDGCRRFSKVYIEVARKNGKTTDAAATANYCFLADRPKEYGPEVYCVATKKDQAKIAWGEAERQLREHPLLRKRTRTYKQNSSIIRKDDSAAVMTIWGKDSEKQDGFNPHFALTDEAHAYPDNSMMEVIESGMGSREQPLIYIITTAGLDKSCTCYQEGHTFAVSTLERTIEPVPESFFCIIYTLDEGDDWMDPSVWIKANPNLGVCVKWAYLEERIQLALQMPSRQNKVKTKHLNIWTQAETRWISDEKWMACNIPVDPEALIGGKCYLGKDLSSSQDVTGIALCFPPVEENKPYKFLYRFFLPEDDIIEKERRDKVPYTYWAEKGYLILTPGNIIDYNFIEQEILNLAARYEIVEIPYDPWKAQEIVNNLTAEGFTMVPMYQRYSAMAAPTNTFEEKILGKQIAHGGNPIMRWMIACTEVKSDRQGNIMPMKPKRGQNGKRIDGVVASIMAIGRAVINEDGDTADVEVYAI